MYGLTRGMMTLIGVAAAGFLAWVASQVDRDTSGGYWTFVALLAAAGLVIALSQLLGGWTKWGWPRISGSVFLLGFLPALVAGGLVLLSEQPDEGATGTGLAGDVGAAGLADDLAAVVPAIAFGLGLVFGLVFDTTGPRRPRDVEVREVRERGAERPVPAGAGPIAERREREEREERPEYPEPVATRPAERPEAGPTTGASTRERWEEERAADEPVAAERAAPPPPPTERPGSTTRPSDR